MTPRPPPTPPKTAANRQTIINGFTDIATTITAATPASPPTTKLTGTDALAVTNAFHSFSTAQTTLLDTVAQSAAGALAVVPFVGPPVTSVLVSMVVTVEVCCLPFLLFRVRSGLG